MLLTREIVIKKLLSAVFLFAFVVLEYAEETVNIGVFLHSPYVETGVNDKVVKGAGIEYIKAVLKEMGYTPNFILLPFPRVISELQSGEIDMSFDMQKNPEREVYAFFPDKPAMSTPPVIVVRSDSKINDIKSINDLKGLTIGALAGTALPKFFSTPDVVTFEFITGENWGKSNLLKLLAKRVDAVMAQNPYSYIAEAKKSGVIDKIRTLPINGETSDFYLVFSKKSKIGSNLQDAYNKVAANNKIDYAKIIENALQ